MQVPMIIRHVPAFLLTAWLDPFPHVFLCVLFFFIFVLSRKRDRSQLERSRRSTKEDVEQLHQQLSTSRHEGRAAAQELALVRRQLEDQEEVC